MTTTALLLLIKLTVIQFANSHHLNSNCDFYEKINIGQKTVISNPAWPSPYSPGGTCRWIFDCHTGYICRLRCREIGLPATPNCYMDKLLVSATGSSQLRDARVYCGQTNINVRSIETRLSIALITSRFSPGGRFRCTVRSEQWAHPWYRARCGPYCDQSYVH
ncbi:unnamed protein product [Arctia plantaginis]|uniref:CUB domain-containing protein n=1 Tax=Arctia plantaginis TaxID=874455 RepID=A0A8S0ZBY8_ARCPL|nr:unnamed protein product [Arctia plantaginis]